jgi:hypothetical protein
VGSVLSWQSFFPYGSFFDLIVPVVVVFGVECGFFWSYQAVCPILEGGSGEKSDLIMWNIFLV